MSVTSHISHLQQKHEDLSHKIETEQRRPAANHLEIAALKRQKLVIKDEIAKLSHH